MINTLQKKGYINRHTDGLPRKECIIKIITQSDGETTHICSWKPYNPSDYIGYLKPYKGFLGKARVIEGPYKGIGFNVWQQNNWEFVYYAYVD